MLALPKAALPLDEDGLSSVCERLGVGAVEVWTVVSVETKAVGFLPDRRPIILFERHVFSRKTSGRFDALYPNLSFPAPGGYLGGHREYERLEKALNLDRQAALESTSWGLGQIMGFNAHLAGFADVEDMVAKMAESENHQLMGWANFLINQKLDRFLRRHNWRSFAKGYNGPEYAKNLYDQRLASFYRKYSLGPLPDLKVRAAQLYLTYLGLAPGAIDGLLGRFTRAALREFQKRCGLAITEAVDEKVLLALRQEVERRAD